jgi:hypothetical protein
MKHPTKSQYNEMRARVKDLFGNEKVQIRPGNTSERTVFIYKEGPVMHKVDAPRDEMHRYFKMNSPQRPIEVIQKFKR